MAHVAEHAVIAEVHFVQHEAAGTKYAIHGRKRRVEIVQMLEHRPRNDEVERRRLERSTELLDGDPLDRLEPLVVELDPPGEADGVVYGRARLVIEPQQQGVVDPALLRLVASGRELVDAGN